MFTGLVLGRGKITARERGQNESLLTIEALFDLEEPLALGESVSCSGVCLTVVSFKPPSSFSAYASSETLKISTLGRRDEVNLERALRPADRLGGHIVSGHVDGTGRVESVSPVGQSLKCAFSFPPDLAPFIVPKGSIAIDGVSLTVNEADLAKFTVNLIPKTAELTTLANLRPGREVNLETDILGRHVKRLLETGVAGVADPKPGLTIDSLIRQGF
jgi:riboflavin synthase